MDNLGGFFMLNFIFLTVGVENSIFFFFWSFLSVVVRRRETAEKTAVEQRHDDDGVPAARRDSHFVVHVQPAAAIAGVHGGGGRIRGRPGARGTVQLGGATVRDVPAGDQRPVGQIQRARHGDDHHENWQVSV